MDLQTKGDFYTHYNHGLLKLTEGCVSAYTKPTGAICTVDIDTSTSRMYNGSTLLVNDALSSRLVEAGITGDVVVHHPTISRNVAKWINYSLGKEDPAEWIDILKVYTFGGEPVTSTVHIEPMEEILLPVDNIKTLIDRSSKDPQFDGLLIKAQHLALGERWYHLLPNRYVSGVITQVITSGANSIKSFICDIVHEGKTYTINVGTAPKWLKVDYFKYRHELLGKAVQLQYTTFTPGDRLRNFGSPAIVSVNT